MSALARIDVATSGRVVSTVPTNSESAGQAEEEWKIVAHSRKVGTLSAAPAINVKPVIGGVEIAVRYVARANERYQLRAKLYQAAVDLLGTKNMPYVGIPVVPAIPTGDYTHKPTNE